MAEEAQAPRALMSSMSAPRADMNEAPPCLRECELTQAGFRATLEVRTLSFSLNHRAVIGTRPPGTGILKIKSSSIGLRTRINSDSQNTGHSGEDGLELRTILWGLSENWSVLEDGRISTRWSG